MKGKKFFIYRSKLGAEAIFRSLVLLVLIATIFTSVPPVRAAEGDIDWIQRVATQHEQSAHNMQMNTAQDADGNVYLFGATDGTLESQNHVGGVDLFIRKYTSEGVEVWSRQFGTTNDDSSLAVAVDASGVYLAGGTMGAFEGFTNAGEYDSFIVKYDLDGSPLWERQFGGSFADYAMGLAAMSDGVVVTGLSAGAVEGAAYLSKYSQDGTLQWSIPFGAAADDQPNGVAVDETGIYVAGSSGSSLFVKKFDLSGSEVWSQSFAGEGGWGLDEVSAVSVYGSRVYVAGSTTRQFTSDPNAGAYDAYIKTFEADGTAGWTRQFGTQAYDYAHNLAVDASGVYVGGNTNGQLPGYVSNGSYDGFVRRYSLEGDEDWTLQFGTQRLEDLSGLSLSSQGIYLAGRIFSDRQIDYSLDERAIFLKKIDLASLPVWTQQFSPITTAPDHEFATSVDANGFVYLAGSIMHNVLEPTAIRPESAFVAKYSPEGAQVWMREFPSQPRSGSDLAYGVAADADGNVYVTGVASGPLDGSTGSGSGGAFLMKYDPDGNLIWVRMMGSGIGYQVGVDSSGIYVAGKVSAVVNQHYELHVFVRKFSLDGVELWADQFQVSSGSEVTGMAVHSSGVYLSGYTFGTLEGQVSAGSYDAFMRKYSLEGAVSWTRQFGTSTMDELKGIDVDDTGIYVTGETAGAMGDQVNAGGYDVFVQKYSLDGGILWTRQFGTERSDYGAGIAVSQAGVYAAGSSYLPITSMYQKEAFIRKFSLDGADAWSRMFDYQTELGEAIGVAVDASGIYVAGRALIMDRFYSLDATLIKLSLHGNDAPVVGAITAPAAPVAANTPIAASASFTDANAADTHTASWDWGDGTTSAGTVSEAGGSGTVSDNHTYTIPGVYKLTLTVTDSALAEGSATYQYVVVYDPSAGFVTGGGWIDSPTGAYIADPTLAGKATFGFVSKYQKGASVPTGTTAFQFDLAGLVFSSTSYEWLVVNQAGMNAQFKGAGLVNGAFDPNGNAYKFTLWAGDGSPDTFRIRIWWEDAAGEHATYDNGTNQAIGAGNIVVHTSK